MDPNALTQKSQEALHDAQTKALRFGHTEVDVEHLLLALLDDQDGLIPRLLARMDVESGGLRVAVERELESRPRVSGAGALARGGAGGGGGVGGRGRGCGGGGGGRRPPRRSTPDRRATRTKTPS